MGVVPPPAVPPEEPSNRWPWIALLAGVLIIGLAVVIFFFNRPRTTDIVVEGTPTPNPAARAASPPPTLAPPALATSAPLPPSPTPAPSATPLPSPTAAPTPPPSPTPLPAPTTPPAPPTAAPAAAPPAPTTAPTAAAAAPAPSPNAPVATGGPIVASPQPAQPPPPAQVAAPGGLGDTRAGFDAAYGPPVGETPEHLVVYRKNNVETHVAFAPEPPNRATLVAQQPQQSGQAFTLDQAMAQARTLLPPGAQPSGPPEGNNQFVVERFPAQVMAVYLRDPSNQSRITRLIVGMGTDPQALIAAAGR